MGETERVPVVKKVNWLLPRVGRIAKKVRAKAKMGREGGRRRGREWGGRDIDGETKKSEDERRGRKDEGKDEGKALKTVKTAETMKAVKGEIVSSKGESGIQKLGGQHRIN